MESLELHKAVKKGNVEAVRALLNNGANINALDFHQCTPLHFAVSLENEEIVKILLASYADYRIKNNINETAMEYALIERNFDMAKVLIDAGVGVNERYQKGKTALHFAVKQNNIDFTEFLISRGVNVNAQDSKEKTPLFCAFNHRDSLEIIKILVKAGADVNHTWKYNTTVLDLAAEKNYLTHIKFLLSLSGVNVVKVSARNSALLKVVKKCENKSEADLYINIAEILLENRADVNSQDASGKTLLHHAVAYKNVRLVDLLLSFNANVFLKDEEGIVPLITAIKTTIDIEIVRLLVHHGSDPNCRDPSEDNYHWTPLIAACHYGEIELIDLFVSYGAEINHTNATDKLTCLHWACAGKHEPKIIEHLLNLGSELEAVDSNGNTPLMFMLKYWRDDEYEPERYIKTLKFLMEYANANLVNLAGENILTHVGVRVKSWNIILQHLAKLQFFGLPVHQSLLNTISKEKKYSDYFEKCTQDLVLAKSTKLHNSWVTFFNILVDNMKSLKNYAGNKELVRGFERSDYKNKFPIYGASMHEKMTAGIKRRKKVDKFSVIISDRLPIFNPSHLIIRDILDALIPK